MKKTTKKQTESTTASVKEKKNGTAKSSEHSLNPKMVNKETSKIKGKRKHSRSFYMAVNPKGGAVVTKKELPIFWKKGLAKQVASKIEGKAVKVTLTWQ